MCVFWTQNLEIVNYSIVINNIHDRDFVVDAL